MKVNLMPEQTEDKKLIHDFLNGDDKSLETLIRKYLSPIYNFLYRLSGDKSSADDLTQETFIKVWKNLSHFDQNKNFKVWIFTIAKNTAFDFFKKKKTIPFSFFQDEEGNNKLDDLRDENNLLPNEIMERENLAQELDKKLEKIPENYRIILLLHYKEDFSLNEIAQILEKPYNTIKSYHQRALLSLKRAFNNK